MARSLFQIGGIRKIGLTCVRTVHVGWPDRFSGVEDGEVQYELLRAGWNGINPVQALMATNPACWTGLPRSGRR